MTIPTVAREVYDVSGAGDTVIATLTLALTAGASLLQAAALANYAAGIEVEKLGVATVSAEELTQRLLEEMNH
jgi:D-beta-D-heptose 7-phosphate kinase/D-beta-D-heptose 1-phosphate adenosyltransferase